MEGRTINIYFFLSRDYVLISIMQSNTTATFTATVFLKKQLLQ